MGGDFSYVGGYRPASDAVAKARGALVYGTDVRLPGMLHAKLLLSEIPHGIVAGIDASEAESLPGVVAVFSCLNTPDTAYSRYRLMPGQESCPEVERCGHRWWPLRGPRASTAMTTLCSMCFVSRIPACTVLMNAVMSWALDHWPISP